MTTTNSSTKTTEERIQEIAARLPRKHYECDDYFYSCPLSEEGCADDRQTMEECNCGAERENNDMQLLLSEIRRLQAIEKAAKEFYSAWKGDFFGDGLDKVGPASKKLFDLVSK